MVATLQDVKQGDAFRIEAVGDDEVRAQLHRMGFLDGEVECRTHVKAGPVIITRHGTDLAVGAPVAKDVTVTLMSAE